MSFQGSVQGAILINNVRIQDNRRHQLRQSNLLIAGSNAGRISSSPTTWPERAKITEGVGRVLMRDNAAGSARPARDIFVLRDCKRILVVIINHGTVYKKTLN